MKVLELNKPMIIGAVLRVAPSVGDNLILKLQNEFSDLKLDITEGWYYEKGRHYFNIDTPPTDFKSGNKYQIIIENQSINKIIYMGNLLIVKENTDIQNYTPLDQRQQRFKSKAV